MAKKNIDWGNIGFGYVQTEQRYVANYKNGAWEEGELTTDANVVLNECAGVLQYAQTVCLLYTSRTQKVKHVFRRLWMKRYRNRFGNMPQKYLKQ